MRTKKDRLRGHADGQNQMKGSTMNYITEKPKAQGVVETEHFQAEVKIFSAGDIRYKIEMKTPVETTKYDEYLDYTRWNDALAREINVLMMRISNFEFDCARGNIGHAV